MKILTIWIYLSYYIGLIFLFIRHKKNNHVTYMDIVMFLISPASVVGTMTTMILNLFVDPDKKVF
jgi:hypothetical protein